MAVEQGRLHSQLNLRGQLESLGYKCPDMDMLGSYPQFYYQENSRRYAAIVANNGQNDPFAVFIFDGGNLEKKHDCPTINDAVHILNSKGIFSDDIPTKGVMDEGM